MNCISIPQKIGYFADNNFQVLLCSCFREHLGLVDLAVSLGTWPLDSWAFATIQQPKLNARLIGHPPHYTVKGINFANKMTFTKASDRGIT